MIPWGHIFLAAGKAAKSLFDFGSEKLAERARRQEYCFESHMQYLSRQANCPLLSLKPDRATFRFTHEDDSFLSSLIHRHDMIVHTLGSNILFPGAIPAVVRQAVSEVIERLRRKQVCDFKVFYSDDGVDNFFLLGTMGPAAELDPGTFLQNLGKMAIVVKRTEVWLNEEGQV
jgi:hypothetical protein